MKIILYHNNNCSKSRECLKLLQEKKVEFQIRNYLKSPLTIKELESIIKNLNDNIEDLLRDKKLIDSNLLKSPDKLAKIIFSNQKILQRPIIYFRKYWICRPPEKVLKILEID